MFWRTHVYQIRRCCLSVKWVFSPQEMLCTSEYEWKESFTDPSARVKSYQLLKVVSGGRAPGKSSSLASPQLLVIERFHCFGAVRLEKVYYFCIALIFKTYMRSFFQGGKRWLLLACCSLVACLPACLPLLLACFLPATKNMQTFDAAGKQLYGRNTLADNWRHREILKAAVIPPRGSKKCGSRNFTSLRMWNFWNIHSSFQ